MSQVDTSYFRELLEQERDRVRSALEYLSEENAGNLEDESGEINASGIDNHPGDTATATHDREVDYTLEENSEQVLADIELALRKIEDGTYGTCEKCGKQIAPERLEAMPWARLCIDDKRLQERG
jgi:RNA polymerase-binding protein DksA